MCLVLESDQILCILLFPNSNLAFVIVNLYRDEYSGDEGPHHDYCCVTACVGDHDGSEYRPAFTRKAGGKLPLRH